MKSSEELQKLRAMESRELETRREELKEQSMKLRFRQSMNQLSDSSQLRKARLEIARINTVLKEQKSALNS